MTTQTTTETSLDHIYRIITVDENGRTCAQISEDACTNVPRNFVLNALNGTATKLAEQIASPGLVLPWFLAALGAPTFLAGFLVPIRRAGSLLPQLAVAGRVRGYPRRKWFWVGAGLTEAAALFLMAVAALILSPLAAGIAVVLLLAVFSIASGVGSVAFSDVMGKTIPKGRRGRLLAVRATSGGGLALIAGFFLRQYVGAESDVTPYLILLGAAALLWFLAALLFAAIEEEPGATEGGRNALKEAQAGWQLLQEQPGFRHFIVARAFLLTVELAIPFYALYARRLIQKDVGNLGIFVMAASLAAVLSSPLWGRFADRSSRTVMAWGGGMAVLTGAYALLFGALPADLQTALVYAPVFLLIGFARAGVRLGRKTYLVDGAPQEEMPLYVALSNSLIGALTLLGSGLGLIAELLGLPPLIVLLALLAGTGALISWRLPEAANMLGSDA